MNDELGRIWKEVIMAKVKVLSQHLHGGTEENHEKPQYSPFSGQDFIPEHPEYKGGMLTTQLQCLVQCVALVYCIPLTM
jgi:hypothetical protein